MPVPSHPTETYLETLIAGDSQHLLLGFAEDATIDDPLGGRKVGPAEFQRYFTERQAWLAERKARVEHLRTTTNERRAISEALLHLQLPDHTVALPVAVVGEHADNGRVRAIRVYHSLWPLESAHRVRKPLLLQDPGLSVTGVIAEYQLALASGDAEAIVRTFEPDGYFREPAGGEYIYQGLEQLRPFMTHLLASGGIELEHCTVTDDGVVCAIEFNAVKFGPHRLAPQAGVGVYERGHSGRLHAARIYDDVNVEVLAQPDRSNDY